MDFNAALRDKISRFTLKYDPQIVFEVWVEMLTSKWQWKPQMTIIEALDYLDDRCDLIETLMQERLEKKQGKG